MPLRDADGMANSVDPDQTRSEIVQTLIRLLHKEQSDLGLHSSDLSI